MSEEINFLELGKKKAKELEGEREYKEFAEGIGQEYGKDAQQEFEVGYSLGEDEVYEDIVAETGADVMADNPGSMGTIDDSLEEMLSEVPGGDVSLDDKDEEDSYGGK
ncbi:MAG: hypothetical protein IJF92_04445 [Bacilli bacterium]|nr:hypothetical protein [Bacilli bacterium]